MNRKYVCYCGLYCENCAVLAKIDPAAKVLYNEMDTAGFEGIMPFLPGGEGFWAFLKNMAHNGTCVSCKEGSGNPGCTVRVCAQEKKVEACAFCENYPCEHFAEFLKNYPTLEADNAVLKDKGWDAWAQLQDSRRANGFTYSDDRNIRGGKP